VRIGPVGTDWVPMGSDWSRWGSMGSDWVISHTAALMAVSVELNKSNQRRLATVNAVIKCSQCWSFLFIAAHYIGALRRIIVSANKCAAGVVDRRNLLCW